MKEVWPNAYLPKDRRRFYLGLVATSMLGALSLALALALWLWPLILVSITLILLAARFQAPFLVPRRKWYDTMIWLVLSIAPTFNLIKILKGPADIPQASLYGAAILVVWAIGQAASTAYLWKTGESSRPESVAS